MVVNTSFSNVNSINSDLYSIMLDKELGLLSALGFRYTNANCHIYGSEIKTLII